MGVNQSYFFAMRILFVTRCHSSMPRRNPADQPTGCWQSNRDRVSNSATPLKGIRFLFVMDGCDGTISHLISPRVLVCDMHLGRTEEGLFEKKIWYFHTTVLHTTMCYLCLWMIAKGDTVQASKFPAVHANRREEGREEKEEKKGYLCARVTGRKRQSKKRDEEDTLIEREERGVEGEGEQMLWTWTTQRTIYVAWLLGEKRKAG